MSGSQTNRLARLTVRPKGDADQDTAVADKVGDRLGFLDRSPAQAPVAKKGKPGRKPSPRTGQLHPKVLPEVAEAISDEAARLGITQGLLIEQMWTIYRRQGRGDDQ